MFQFLRSLFQKSVRIPQIVSGKNRFIKIDSDCEHISTEPYGSGWTICPYFIDEDSIIYSFGIGYNISFDLEIINSFDATIFAFDPTPKSIEWINEQNLPKQFILNEYGIANFDGKAKFHPPENPRSISATLLKRSKTENAAYKVEFKTLNTIMYEHNHQQVDLIKINIEGAEYKVIDNLIKTKIKPSQLLIKFHHKFNNVGINKTINAVNKLRDYGYNVFSVSKAGTEISFIKKELKGF